MFLVGSIINIFFLISRPPQLNTLRVCSFYILEALHPVGLGPGTHLRCQ
jgi:hypothetical protein